MKKFLSILLAFIFLSMSMLIGAPTAVASKAAESRAIAIVFDNSGSMYVDGNQAWCRATYAMEVFASMLNAGDILQIYPMWPINVGSKTYSQTSPLVITKSSEAATIRDIFTPDASGTPIESVDNAAAGLKKVQADKKYMIILTDGGTFSRNDNGLTKEDTKKALDKCVKAYAGAEMTVMYLGVGADVCLPTVAESEYFVKKQAVNSADVLSTLTVMCNQIFGRDTLPKSRVSGNKINIDVSMRKMIVFVQGENIAGLKLTGASVGKPVSTQQTQYSTKGAGDYPSVPDKSLQGMMVTYENLASGTYNIEYTGTATSVEVYYEPDAALDFVFTDADGNTVAPEFLYEGNYKVSFGMKDAKTGKLISSDLLGSPEYQGSYFINGQEYPITHKGFSGSVDIPLKMGETFDANLTVTYLSGYTIYKDASDFGWPEGGIKVAARPAGDLKLEITGGDDYTLQDLANGKPYIAKVYYLGEQLKGAELEKVELKWKPETSNAEIKKEFAEDHWELYLSHKDPSAPQNTVCGECTVSIHAFYSAKDSDEAKTQTPLTYNIKDSFSPVKIEFAVPNDYIVIKELEASPAIEAKLTLNGQKLTPEEFAAVTLQVDCGGIEHTVTANEKNSSYLIKLLPTNGIEEGRYSIKVSAEIKDEFGRTAQSEEFTEITLSNLPLWVKWVISLLALLILAIIIWIILHIKVLPKHMHTTKRLSTMNFDGDDVSKSSNFLVELKKKGVKAQTQYGGKKFGVSMDVVPGKESYLYKSAKRRSAEVKVASVRKFGTAKIQEAMIGSAKYVVDENTGKLVPALPNQKPFALTNGMMIKYSGTIQDAGIDKDFEATSKLNFKKK